MMYSLEAKKAMRLIVADMKAGRVPWDVKLFSQIHDYVDANEYLLEVMEIDFDDMEPVDDVIAELSFWLQRGGQHELLPPL